MCGRFTQTEKKAEALTERFGAILSERTDKQELEGAMGRYNVAPTQAIPAIVAPEGKPELRLLRWGLLPHWAKDRSYGYKTINAKLETVRQKPTYRGLIGKAERHRCLIVADGFYEWQKPEDPKQPRIPLALHRRRRGIVRLRRPLDHGQGRGGVGPKLHAAHLPAERGRLTDPQPDAGDLSFGRGGGGLARSGHRCRGGGGALRSVPG